MRAAIFALSALLLASCSTTQVYSNLAPGQAAPVNTTGVVQVYYSYPTRPYEVIGVVSAKRYKPGFTDPTVSDAIPQLRAAGQQLGAHAVVVRNARSLNDRHTVVEAEAIRFKDIPEGTSAPAASTTECKSCAKIGGG
jgi:hypothetical protein